MAIQPTFIYKTFDVALELKQTSTNPTFSVIEGDTGNRLHITVTDGGSAVDLTGCRVIAVFSKSNGISMQDNCVANNGITIGGTNNNEVTIDLFSSSLAPGNVECELQIYSGLMEVLITTARFNFTCRRGIMNEDVLLSTNEYPLLIELINIVEGFVDAEDGRVLAEQERADAEGDRVTAETERANAESLRVSAEAARVSAESGRAAEMAKWASAKAVANTLAAGSSATATISEADDAKQFTFGIPVGKTGAKGDEGEQGVGIQSITPQGQDESGGNIYTVTLTDNTTYTITAPKGDSVGAANLKDGSSAGSLRSVSSVAESGTYTIGEAAVALGYGTKASGHFSHAEGYSTTASGQDSHAEGVDTLAEGYRSHAEGYGTRTALYAPNSHAEGWGTIAGSPEQHVQGRYNIEDENSKYAHVVGNGWESGDVVTRSNAHTLSWTGNAWYQGTIKVGGTGWDDATDEVAYKSDLEGLNSINNLVDGSAEGSVRSIGSIPEGDEYTIGRHAFALGYLSRAQGSYSHTEGYKTTASGQNGHAEGVSTVASGGNSHAEGSNTIARVNAQHVQGKWNIEDDTNNLAHIVGNGTSSNRSNAHTLDWSGNAWYQGEIRVGGTSYADATRLATIDEIGGGGGGPNVLNADGIIKQEHLPSGYPYSEVAEIVPDTEVVIDPDSGMGMIVDQFALAVGGEYTVTWNGTEYACTGQEYSLYGVPCVAVGNVNALNGEPPTDEPFVILNLGPDVAAAEGAYGAVFAFDGSASATVSISGTLITKIDAAYIPDLGGVANIVDGSNLGSLRSLMSAAESDEYTMGIAAVALGYGTKASGEHSHAEGSGTTASDVASHAEGGNTTASGVYSHAEGSGTTASGAYSHAEGRYTKASGVCQHVQGKCNVEDTAGTYAHIVGNGTSDSNRSNAHTLDWDGNAWFAGTMEGTAVILKSSTAGSTKRFRITVDDSGNLSATEITE